MHWCNWKLTTIFIKKSSLTMRLISRRSYKIYEFGMIPIHSSVQYTFTYIVCVNFLHKWLDLQFKLYSARKIFEKLFMPLLFIVRVIAWNLFNTFRKSHCGVDSDSYFFKNVLGQVIIVTDEHFTLIIANFFCPTQCGNQRDVISTGRTVHVILYIP